MRPIAIIDIGSNSVRLVLYRKNDGVWFPVINEKVQCRLGEGVGLAGSIQPERMQEANEAFRRFKTLLELSAPEHTIAIATSAVREADNGPDLVRHANDVLGVEPQVLSGADEADYAAAGVLWANPYANGLVCDLGGSSLELAPVGLGQNQHIGGHSVVVGPLQLFDLFAEDRKAAKAYIDSQLKTALAQFDGKLPADLKLCLVGGAWRALAALHMKHLDHPLSIIHRYSPSPESIRDYLRPISFMKRDQALALDIAQPDRRITLPYAALILRRLMKWSGARAVEFNGVGIREGALAKCLASIETPTDTTGTYLKAVQSLVRDGGRFGPIGGAVFEWIKPAVSANFAGIAVLPLKRIEEACHLADFGWNEHPSHKKSQTYSSILHSAVLPHDHKERTQLAAIQYYRHKGRSADLTAVRFAAMLTPREHQAAKVLGRMIQLSMQICRARPELLNDSHLSIQDDELVIQCPAHWPPLGASSVLSASQMLSDAAKVRVKFA